MRKQKTEYKTTLRLCIFLFITALALHAPQQVFADLDNKGTSFIIGFTPNYPSYSGYKVALHLTSEVATEATINYPVNSPTFTTTVAVTPGSITVVDLPVESQSAWVADTILNNAVEVAAKDEVVAYMINLAPATSDAALALPVDTLNNEYIVSTYNEAFIAAAFVIVAPFDNTTVTITPSNNAKGGHSAGVPFDVVLNRGQGFMVQGAVNGLNGGLAGSVVTSDKPIEVTNGNGCTQVPLGTPACDTLMEVAQPVQSWGKEALVVNLPNRPSGSIYRVVAAQDNTSVSLDGAVIGTINRGGYLETAVLPGSHVISGDNPIFVTQYMTGQNYSGATLGDPAMGNMIPTAQFLKDYTFSTVGGSQFAQHYLSIIAKNADVGALVLDGIPVDATQFSPIVGTDYSAAVLRLPEGTHTTSSVNPHGITVEGYNDYDSYLYPGGALFRFINPVGDPFPPICDVSSMMTLNGTLFTGSGTDNRPSEDTNGNKTLDPGEDLNNNGIIDKDTGIFFIALKDGAQNLKLMPDMFVPGSGKVNFNALPVNPSLVSSGVVVVTDGAGNTCEATLKTVLDCKGIPGGSAKFDICGVCNGDGSSCAARQCNIIEQSSSSKRRANTALSTARNLVKRTQLFAAKAQDCGMSASSAALSISKVQKLYRDYKNRVSGVFIEPQEQCGQALCSDVGTSSTSRYLNRLTERMYQYQRQSKLDAIRYCMTQPSSAPDTRMRSSGYRDLTLQSIKKLPQTATLCGSPT